MTKLRSYFLPDSLAWWAGVLSVVLGALMVWFPGDPSLTKLAIIWGAVVSVQDIGGTGFIAFGVMAIGVRAKLERILPTAWEMVEDDE